MERPRKNQTKLLLLMDSGGSMWAYADLCNRLFQAVNQSSHFKDLKIYYFHNCFYDQLFTTPSCSWRDKISTEWVFHNLKPELVMEAFAKFLGIELEPFALMIHREEVYADRGEEEIPQLVSLEALGDVIV